jgi:aspartate carbamoyltransferase catalytic subunit
MGSSKLKKRIAKMDPAKSKIYQDAKRVLETVEDTESEEFVAAARIVKTFWQKATRTRGRSDD